ncbi:hypothetical protein FNH22_20190 [Fulvivirga sp. M361]|uniref:hypothetical protein n=1 Tax=Fulvivirga sp. M361 TaxID=2594266 RepID=UPI00117BD08E|nr:hypothetical protein [Fulvivirga sp. M361]TRX53677.1 hypothetical protein FNH22_20190 [Fulvivirga sp. M361]
MKILEVNSEKLIREFIKLPVRLYKNEANWIRPLDKDIESVFDTKKNKAFRHGECVRWLLQNDAGRTIGRIAAFINKKTINKDNDQPTGGVGFFECEKDKDAAFKLFDTAKEWLTARGIEAMDGPVNFGERDKWWGLLVDGFDIEPNYNCNYNFLYYQELFEAYGFQTYFKQFTFGRKVRAPFSAKLMEKGENILQGNTAYNFRHMEKSKLDEYTEHFRIVYNKAWARHKGVAQMSSLQAKNIMKQMKPILDEKIVWFGYYHDEPIAFYINLPEVNQIFKYVNGKMDLIGKLKFLWHKWRKSCNKMLGLVFGIAPEHQGKGVEGALVLATAQMVQKDYPRYDDLEMNWIGDFNPKMIRVVEQVGGDIVKTHITYRKLFDETKPFKRAPMQ